MARLLCKSSSIRCSLNDLHFGGEDHGQYSSDFRNFLGVSIPSVVSVVDCTMFTRIDRVLRIGLIPGKYENCKYSK